MTTPTPRPVSDDSSPEAPSPFCGDQDEEPNPLLGEYEQLCPGGLDEGAVEEDDEVRAAEQPAGSAVDATTEATAATEEQGDKKKKKRRRKLSFFVAAQIPVTNSKSIGKLRYPNATINTVICSPTVTAPDDQLLARILCGSCCCNCWHLRQTLLPC